MTWVEPERWDKLGGRGPTPLVNCVGGSRRLGSIPWANTYGFSQFRGRNPTAWINCVGGARLFGSVRQ